MTVTGDDVHLRPVAPVGRLDRPRLLARLGQMRPGHVTVLSAPAGSGKTCLAEQWLALHDDVDVVRVATRGDAKARFSPGVLSELANVDRGILFIDAIDSSDEGEVPRPIAPLGVLGDLVERAPANVHTLVTCRSPWRERIARLHAQGRIVTKLDASDLAFDGEETRGFVRHLAGRELTDAQLEALLARTEGWALGIQMIGLELRTGTATDESIARFRGDDRRLVAFFHEHVLDRHSTRVRRFLRHSSVLGELNGSLCGAVSGDPAGRALLQLVEQRGDFVRRTNGEPDRFEFQGLFREVLRNELRVTEPGTDDQLLLRAAAWHAKRGEPWAAVPLLVEAEAWDQLIGLVDRFGRRIFEEGEAARALGWLASIPAGWTHDRGALGLRLGFLHTMKGETRIAEQIVHDLETRGLRRGDAAVANALRATWAFFDSSPESVLVAADAVTAAVETLSDDEIPDILGLTSRDSLAVVAAGARGRVRWHLGDRAGARRDLLEVIHRPNVYSPWLLQAMGTLALLEAWAGELRLAQQHARQALRVATSAGLVEHPSTIDARHALAHVTRERGGQGGAEAFLDSALAIATRSRRPVSLAVQAVERSLWHLAGGLPELGLEEIHRLRTSGEAPPPPMVAARLRATEVRLLLAVGDRERAQLALDAERLDCVGGGHGAGVFPELSAVAVQVALSGGDLEAARVVLDEWTVDEANPGAGLERDLWSAIGELARGSRRQAVQHGLTLLAKAEVEGHLRLFLDAGRPAERLLHALVNADPSPYARGIVSVAQATAATGRTGPVSGLTERELAVARYLPTPLSSSEIAAQLYISRNTLKTHLQTVYRKLGVSGRQEAIRRAQELGLA